ncbi:fungal-specific transcription factor domain-containing protein, partial [Bombardia bombarda]
MTTTSNPSVKRRSPSEDSSDSSSQDRASPSTYISRQLSKQQIRHRASVACASCRERRIRCVVPEGDSECTQCKRTGAQCIIKNDDERRRRPISKAYMSSLSSRITLLEGMLKERGVLPPPAIHPPKTRQEAQVQEREDSQTHDIPSTAESIQASSPERGAYTSVGSKAGEEIQVTNKLEKTYHPVESYPTESCFIEPALLHDANSRDGDRVRQLLLGAKGNFSFDGTCSRPQFFGSTANGHVYAGSGSLSQISSKEVPEQVLCTVRSIRSICSSTLDYLTACFWAHYDPTLQVVDRSAFEADRDSQNSNFYSEFLHIAILASGYKFADRDREDMKRLALGNWESTLHRETKHTANLELERPGGIPSVQALLLLSNLEYGVGRDTAGWMYSGMAIRLAFDIGLHVKCSSPMITEKERQIRRQVMTACVMFDRRWALLLGRPTSIKIQDIGFELTEESHHSLSSVNSLPPYQGIATDDLKRTDATARQQMVELMSLAARIADLQNTSHSTTDMYAMNELEDNAQLHVVTLDRQLQNWHRRLPGHLTWEPANIKSAPFSFFALHQQYHVCMILLHRPWAKYGPSEMDHELPKSPASIDDDNRVSLSRSICTQHAVRVARVFWQHRQRFDGRKMSSAGIQHAGTSAIALMAELAHGSKGLDHQSNLRYLQVLSAAIYDMSRVYQPAAKMYQLLRSVLADIRANLAVS